MIKSSRTADAAVLIENAAWRKCSRRVLPLLFGIFFFSHLNRVNLSYAADDMSRDLSFSPVVYGFGAGLFFLTYALFQIPANLVADRFGVVRVMVLLMICWGITSLSNGLIYTSGQFYALRFLLGVFEAGITPVTLLLLTFWFTEQRRGTAFSLFAVAMPISGAVGGPISYAILEFMDGIGGLEGWRWLFILEALPTLIIAGVTLKYLPASPATARWLSDQERARLSQPISDDAGTRQHAAARVSRSRLYQSKFVYRTVLLSATWGFFVASFVGFFYWMPTLLTNVFDVERVGLLVGILYCALAITLMFSGRWADKVWWTRELLLAALVTFALSMFLAMSAVAVAVVAVCFLIAMSAVGVGQSAFWSVTLSEFSPDEAPLGIGIVNCSGAVGAFGMLYIYGLVAETTGSIQMGLITLAIGSGIAAVITVCWYGQVGVNSAESLSA